MGHSSSTKRLAATAAGTAALVVTAGLAGTVQATAASGEDRLKRDTAAIQELRDAAGRLTAKPRALQGKHGRQAFFLELEVKSTHAAFRANRGRSLAAAKTASRNQLDTVEASQGRVASELPRRSRVLYKTHAALSGMAVSTDADNFAQLQGISGVKAVHPIASKTPSNAYAVPLIGAPSAWENFGNLGQDTTIAIIDTGLDYTHANFGGPGTVAAFNAANAADTVAPNPADFSSAKFLGGFDFAGDAYDPSSDNPAMAVPQPDPNPLDCNGHGSHVGGSAAGVGVTEDGEPYTGTYNEATPFDTLKIGPGVAPAAKLYGFRVFGCDGSSDVVGQAMDRALDPNGDGDTTDKVDVVNMSLGSDFGSSQDGDSVLADYLAAAGVNVVVSSGNGGDVYDVGGSPGNAPRTITVANSVDEYSQLDALHVSGPAAVAGDYGSQRSIQFNWSGGDLAGEVAGPLSAANDEACDPLSPADAALVSGKIAWVEWQNFDGAFLCGSVARANNLAAAGATGFIFASDVDVFSAGINGNAAIPGVIVSEADAGTLRTQLDGGITVSGTTANGFRQINGGIDDTLNTSSSRNSRGEGGVKPDVAAVGTTVFSTGVGTGAEGANMSGTSMAAPMVAGLTALVVNEHPGWNTEEVKADIMNTAGQDLFTNADHTGDRYAPNRVGAGRVDAAAAVTNDVVAYVDEDDGAVSVSFGTIEAAAPITRTKTINVVNKGSDAATYNVFYEALTEIPGVEYSVSPDPVTVPPGTTRAVTVTLTVDPAQLTKPIDPTMDRVQAELPREYLAEASGRVVLEGTSGHRDLRVPVYSAPRPVSEMTQASSLTLTSGESPQTGSLDLTGSGVFQDAGDDSIFSIVSGFELQVESGPAPLCGVTVTEGCVHNADERSSDVEYVGTTSRAVFGPDPVADGLAYFAISTHGPWYTAASQTTFEVYLDTTGDKVPDFVTINTRFPETDTLVTATFDLETGANVDVQLLNDRFGDTDTALFDSDTMVLPVWLGALGDNPDPDTGEAAVKHITEAHPRINYGIAAFSNQAGAPVDSMGFDGDKLDGSLSVNVVEPALVIGSGNGILDLDEPETSLDVVRNWASYDGDNGLGAMIVHHHNKVGEKAQVVTIEDTRVDVVGVTLDLEPTSVQAGGTVTSTVIVTGANGVATGQVVIEDGAGRTLGSGMLDSGAAIIDLHPITAGTFPVEAKYSGDATYHPATSGPEDLTVTKAPSTVSLALSTASTQAGKTVTATATVANTAGVMPTGTVTFKSGSRTLGSGTVNALGKATIAFKATPAGTHSVVAQYAGNATYAVGASAAKTLTVTKIKPTVSLKLPAQVRKGALVTATVTVTTVNGLVPTGKVSMKKGTKVLRSSTLSNGKATLRFRIGTRGSFKLYAQYAGDGNYASGKSTTKTLKVV